MPIMRNVDLISVQSWTYLHYFVKKCNPYTAGIRITTQTTGLPSTTVQ